MKMKGHFHLVVSFVWAVLIISGHCNPYWRNVREAEDPNIAIIEADVAKLDLEKFNTDITVKQKVDKLNQLSDYVSSVDDNVILYERNKDDSEKDIIVLTKDEDGIVQTHKKRIYVVLRRAKVKSVDQKKYHAVVAFVRFVFRFFNNYFS